MRWLLAGLVALLLDTCRSARLPRAAGAHHRAAHAGRLARHHRALSRREPPERVVAAHCGREPSGGSQNIGADLVAKSAPDGHTWLLAPDNVFSVNPHLGKQPFDPFADFIPVTQLARIQFLLVVHPSLPVSSVSELVAYAKARPGELNHGSSGNGSPQHLGAAMFQLLTGTKLNHVPYKGAAPAVADLLPGRIQVWIGAANTLLPHIKDGRLRLLGDSPTIAQSVPGYSLDPWLGLFVPAKTPAPVVQRIHAEVTKIVNGAELKSKLGAQGIVIDTTSPQEFAHFIREDHARWGKVIREAGIKGE